MQVVYTAQNFQSSNVANLKMVLALKDQSCGIALHSDDNKIQYLAYYNFLEPLKDNESLFFDFVRSQDFLRQKYKAIHIVLDVQKFTLVPNAIFDALHTDSYLRYIHTKEKSDIVKNIEVAGGEVQMIFCADEHLFYPARSKYYESIIEPVNANYLRKTIKHYPNKLNVFIEDKSLHIIHAVNNKPVFFNAFSYENVDEAAYFILNYYQVFNISHDSLPLVLHGKVHPQLKEMIGTYSSKCEYAKPINNTLEAPKDFEFPFLIDFIY